ncbi:hypothetical protein PENCOP_c012G03637 [Penicillium coprophilum]|uniref:Uncharacterized protein n=1 Tax=Penicillium coprophilum TaxID=36646 RepID=A0A1V6UCD8_9EURO|nr:hypothetical protein PENCOP_c012G03637 [Penicillium coprophilum]
MGYALVDPVPLTITAPAIPVPKQDEVVGDAGIVVHVDRGKTIEVKHGGSSHESSDSDVIGKFEFGWLQGDRADDKGILGLGILDPTYE